MWGIAPTEFWTMTTREWGYLYDSHTGTKDEGDGDPDYAELLKILKEGFD